MLDPIVHPWDIAPIAVIIPESGGKFTDLGGVENVHGGSGLATNGHLHDDVLAVVTGHGRASFDDNQPVQVHVCWRTSVSCEKRPLLFEVIHRSNIKRVPGHRNRTHLGSNPDHRRKGIDQFQFSMF